MTDNRRNIHSIAAFIEEYYPEYWNKSVSYPANKCACIRKVKEEWGILGNFGSTPLDIDGVVFDNSERLFQTMKFCDAEVVRDMFRCRGGLPIKNKSKSYETKGFRRDDWGSYFIDALKFCLMKKYEQSEDFRNELERSKGLFIVEDETARRKGKGPDAYGVVLVGDNYEGYNLLGILLMELRDNGSLEYKLPDDALDFIKALKDI